MPNHSIKSIGERRKLNLNALILLSTENKSKLGILISSTAEDKSG